MKQVILTYIILLIGFIQENIRATNNWGEAPRILIINSYSVEQDHSERITRQIQRELLKKYPNANIHSGNLNTDRAVSMSVPQLALRSLLWSFVEDASDEALAESLGIQTVFSSPVRPDVIVFVGLDGLLFYQSFGCLLNQWKNIPLVMCSMNDSSIKGDWSTEYDYTDLIPIEERRTINQFIAPELLPIIEDKTLQLTPCNENNGKGYKLTQSYNLTGVKSSLPVRENLELIHSLIPDLAEIVWIDNDYYASGYARFLVEKEMKEIMPGVKFATTKHNKINSDSIFNEMLQAVPGKAYLTFAWSIHGIYSKHSEKFLHELFTEKSTIPFFSLTQPTFENNYRLGGYFLPTEEYVDKTVSLVSRILKGESASSIPFESVTKGNIILNQTLLRKYGLEERTQNLTENIKLVNTLPSFFEIHEKTIFGISLFIIIVIGMFFFLRMWRKQNRLLKKESERYQELSDVLKIIYNYASADFALYDDSGNAIMYNVNDNGPKDKIKFLSGNLFENLFLSTEQKQKLHSQEVVDTEVFTETEDVFSASFVEKNIYQLIILPLNDSRYTYTQYLLLVIDHTPVMRERTEKLRFEKLLDFASGFSKTGMAYYNLDTNSIVATPSWYQNLNEPVQTNHLPQYANVLAEDRFSLLDFRERAKRMNRESLITDIRVKGAEGETHWIRQYLYSNQWNINLVIEVNINIDQIKKKETELYEAKKLAEQANHETKEFLSNINHEIRTPLNSIVGFSVFLAMNDNNEENKEYVNLIYRANVLLFNLIEDIILLSKVDSGEVAFQSETVNLNSAFAGWAEYCRSNLFDKKLNIICDISDEEISICTDWFYINRLMINLLNNAIKFTETGSIILGFRVETDHYFFYVKDSGCGIDNVHQQLIFKHFTKLNTFIQGTGLGLTLCKRIVEKLGGEIGVNSRPDKGSTFWFTLPRETN